MAYPEPMTDIRQRIIDKASSAVWREPVVNISTGHQKLILAAAREMAILIRERLTEMDFDDDGIVAELISELDASLVSAETPRSARRESPCAIGASLSYRARESDPRDDHRD